MGLIDDIAGVADHAAGSVDESIGRQFDNTPGGGFADEASGAFSGGVKGAAIGADATANFFDPLGLRKEIDNNPGGSYIAGPLDHAAGSVDESIGRQFDNTPGGGIADEAVGGIGSAITDAIFSPAGLLILGLIAVVVANE